MLHYHRSGSGPKLLLIHGFLEDSTMWNPLNLEEAFDVLTIDLPGHGKSPEWKFETPSIGYCVDLIIEVLGAEDFQPLGVIGHSLGGYVALELDRKQPCEKLILLNSNFWEDSPEKKKDRQRVIDIVENYRSRFIKEAVPGLFSDRIKFADEINLTLAMAEKVSTEGIQAATKAMMNRRDHTDRLMDDPNRFYVIQGELDTSTPLEEMLKRIGKVQKVVLKNSGHMCHFEAPSQTRNSIMRFFKD